MKLRRLLKCNDREQTKSASAGEESRLEVRVGDFDGARKINALLLAWMRVWIFSVKVAQGPVLLFTSLFRPSQTNLANLQPQEETINRSLQLMRSSCWNSSKCPIL